MVATNQRGAEIICACIVVVTIERDGSWLTASTTTFITRGADIAIVTASLVIDEITFSRS